jgi:hypothetical protein
MDVVCPVFPRIGGAHILSLLGGKFRFSFTQQVHEFLKTPEVMHVTHDFVSASGATQVQTSPHPTCSDSGVTFLRLVLTKAQVPSHCRRCGDGSQQKQSQDRGSRFRTVCSATPVMRTMAFIEFPSTKAATAATLRVGLSMQHSLNYVYHI